MRIDIYHHFEPETRDRELLGKILTRIEQLRGLIMSVSDQLKQLSADFDAETTAISNRIDALTAKLGDTVDPSVVAEFQAISDRLKVLGTDPTNPIPPQP